MHKCIYKCYKCCTSTPTLAMNDASGAAAIACQGDENQNRGEPRERPRGEQQRPLFLYSPAPRAVGSCLVLYNKRELGKPQILCFEAFSITVFHGIRLDFKGTLRRYVEQKVFDGRVGHQGLSCSC